MSCGDAQSLWNLDAMALFMDMGELSSLAGILHPTTLADLKLHCSGSKVDLHPICQI